MSAASTKEKILESAIELFNEHGAFNVSMRMIADAADISVGNLTYHFHKKDDLISEILLRLIRERDIYQYSANITLLEFHRFLEALNRRHEHCSFLYDDLVSLTKQYRLVREAEIQATSELKFFYSYTIKAFTDRGYMYREKFKGHYNNLADAMITISSFYTQQKTIAINFPSQAQTLVTMIWSLMLSNFTTAGRQEFMEEVFPLLGLPPDSAEQP